MKRIKTFDSFLNENEGNDEMEYFYNMLRREHPRSSHTEYYINKVKSLFSGEIDMLPRSDFREKMGTQWGLEWIDMLIRKGKLVLTKEQRKDMLILPGSNRANDINIKNFEDNIMAELYKIERQSGNPDGYTFKYDKEKKEIVFKDVQSVITWFHHEKGYGDYTSKAEQKKHMESIKTDLENFYLVKRAKEMFEKAFGSAKVTTSESYDESKIGPAIPGWGHEPQGHKGFEYTAIVTISK